MAPSPRNLARCREVGYRIHVALAEAIARNAGRTGRARVPEHALRSAWRQWQPPDWAEGFNALFEVWSEDDGFQLMEVDRAQ